MTASLVNLARALGGDVVGRQVLCPGPGHSRKDRSLSVTLSPSAPDGFLCRTFSERDTDLECKDYVRSRLGLPAFQPQAKLGTSSRSGVIGDQHGRVRPSPASLDDSDTKRRIEAAQRIAQEMVPWRGTLVERYLREQRGLNLDPSLAELGYHERCPWREANGRLIRVPAMIGVMRAIATEQVVAIHRTRLTPNGHKVDRRMLGIASSAAIMLCPYSAIGAGVTIAEGIESALSGWQLGWSNCWALGSAGGIASFPLIEGVQSLVVLTEDDDANRRAVDTVARRYDDAGREVILVHPAKGNDLNDAIREVPA